MRKVTETIRGLIPLYLCSVSTSLKTYSKAVSPFRGFF